MSETSWHHEDYVDAIAAEMAQYRLVEALAGVFARAAVPLWRIGDGYGSWIRQTLEEAFAAQDLQLAPHPGRGSKRKELPAATRKLVFERDEYRCRKCGDFHDLTVDHIHPVIAGGTNDPDNLQTLCRPCNLRKGTKT